MKYGNLKMEEVNELLDKVREEFKGALITDEEIMMIINNGNPNTSRLEILKKLIGEKREALDRADEVLDQLDSLIENGLVTKE